MGAALGLETLEFLDAVELGFAGGVDAALEADLVLGGVAEGFAEFVLVAVGMEVGLHFVFEEVGFDAEEALEEPGVADDAVEDGALHGGGGLVVAVEGVGEVFEGVFVFAGDDGEFGIDAGLERVQARDGLTCVGGGAGGFLCVFAVGFDLFLSGHGGDLPSAGEDAYDTIGSIAILRGMGGREVSGLGSLKDF